MTDQEKGLKFTAEELYEDFQNDSVWKCVPDMGFTEGTVYCIYCKMISKYDLQDDTQEMQDKRSQLYEMVHAGIF